MTVETIKLLRNVGQFDSVSCQIPLSKMPLIYAENGRGKTTLAAIFRSLSTGDASLIQERTRIGSTNSPHIILNINGSSATFQNGAWSSSMDRIAVFDDNFVAQNVCSGIEIEPAHRQKLHELIIGAQGITLSNNVQQYAAKIDEHNRTLRAKEEAIPLATRGNMTIEKYCAIPPVIDIDLKVKQAERRVEAANAASAIERQQPFLPFALPTIDKNEIESVLTLSMAELQSSAGAMVQAHFAALGKGGEEWVADGMARLGALPSCPFCAQDLSPSQIIKHYEAYFSNAYKNLRNTILNTKQSVASANSGEVIAAFERSVKVAIQSREFWCKFIDIPEIDLDTASISRLWIDASEEILAALTTKYDSPLEPIHLSAEGILAIQAYSASIATVADLSEQLQSFYDQIQLIKEQTASANLAALVADLQTLKLTQGRYASAVDAICVEYLQEKAAKSITEDLRDQAKAALDQYRQAIFPAYETAINNYLQKFNAGFRLTSVTSTNNRQGPSCTYSVLINSLPIALTASTGPSFRNTLSAGDRNTLALAFFFASLDQDSNLAQKVVIIDDPMTSLDEHRSLATVLEMRRLLPRISQLIVLSHSKPFLCNLWEGTDTTIRSALRINRNGTGSTLAVWDVRQDCLTEHDRRHKLVTEHLQAGNPSVERAVAAALRPIMEAFMRVAYPATFPPGTLLGRFCETCRQKIGTSEQIMSQTNVDELRALLDYANKFHHDTNPAWETEHINDQELRDFCERTLAFTSHR